MPSIQLPSFRRDGVAQDDISEFLERFTQPTSHLPSSKTRLPPLEQQCVGDWPRSTLSIAKLQNSMNEKPQTKSLTLSAIQQERGESVEQFAFKYKNCIKWRNLAKRLRKIVSPLLFHSLFVNSIPLKLPSSQLWKHQNWKRSIRPSKRLVVLSCHFKLRP